MASKLAWIKDKEDAKTKKLICHKCVRGSFLLVHEPMARQVKSRTAHHMRLVATCTGCGAQKRVGFKR
jgi:RNase P subunit RPR2